ncbi:Galactoside O-acetyltransferase [compost metagenome]
MLRTRIFYPKAKLIRFPIDIRGRKYIVIEKGLTTGVGCRLEAYSKNEKVLYLGENVQINDYVHITAMKSVVVGNNVLIASKVYISDCSHGSYSGDEMDSCPESIPRTRPYKTSKVVIEDNVWIGEMVSILPGVTIGRGTIIGANSVVTKDLPPNVIAVGSPAIPIKKYNFINDKWEKITSI